MYVYDLDQLGRPEFRDRSDAGQKLGKTLAADSVKADIVMGLTRGGVPVASAVAEALSLPLDIIVVKKIGAPFSHELAIGAVCSDGSRVLHEHFIQELGISGDYVDEEARRMLKEARAAEEDYRAGRPSPGLDGRAVILVDDGIATGSTMEAATVSVRNRGAARVVIAVPVASPESEKELTRVADAVISLLHPAGFFSVGQFYSRFDQVPDDEVKRLVAERRAALVE